MFNELAKEININVRKKGLRIKDGIGVSIKVLRKIIESAQFEDFYENTLVPSGATYITISGSKTL